MIEGAFFVQKKIRCNAIYCLRCRIKISELAKWVLAKNMSNRSRRVKCENASRKQTAKSVGLRSRAITSIFNEETQS